jgi:hypothetical protein
VGVNGAGRETRTPNRPITNRVLYQLSHASTEADYYNRLHCVSSIRNTSYLSFEKSVFDGSA